MNNLLPIPHSRFSLLKSISLKNDKILNKILGSKNELNKKSGEMPKKEPSENRKDLNDIERKILKSLSEKKLLKLENNEYELFSFRSSFEKELKEFRLNGSYLPQKNDKDIMKKTLFLDIDETIVHSSFEDRKSVV